MAGVEGVEPSHAVPETGVLPLDDTPVLRFCAPLGCCPQVQARECILRTRAAFVNTFFELSGKSFIAE